MQLEVITLDSALPVSGVLARLARYGIWADPEQADAKAWIAENAQILNLSFDDVEQSLARDATLYEAAIRRQWYVNILWYVKSAEEVLEACLAAPPDFTLLDALNLHESDSQPWLELRDTPDNLYGDGVVLEGDMPVSVNLPQAPGGGSGGDLAEDLAFDMDVDSLRGGARGAKPAVRQSRSIAFEADRSIAEKPKLSDAMPSSAEQSNSSEMVGSDAATQQTEINAWPRIEAPQYIPAQVPFEVSVGLASEKQEQVAGGEIHIPVPAGLTRIDLTIELAADGIDAIDGWTRPLQVKVNDPTSSVATFRLVGLAPAGPEPVHLTTLEVSYVLDGAVCGTASCPIVIGEASSTGIDDNYPKDFGKPWLDQPVTVSSMDFRGAGDVADLTIEIMKPDGNGANGCFSCRLRSPHALTIDAGPHNIDLGHDAKTFAKSIVERIRQYSGDPIVDNLLNSVGDLVAEKLPAETFNALQQISKLIAPAVPAVLIVSAEPYVPWELARMDRPLDATRPPFLGAQAMVGRWLRSSVGHSNASRVSDTDAVERIEKPPLEPPARISVRNMAVMAGMYMAESGLRKLPAAENEAKTLVNTYNAIPLAASTQALKQLLDARLEYLFEQVGPADAVHFAGHGEFDPTRPDASVLFLSDGRPLSAFLFRSANYGEDAQPLIFLNACMIGIGGELLGEMGGFPGNCLRGGFGGVLGALWEIDDTVAANIALEFWQRALTPPDGSTQSVGEILRDLRAKYLANGADAPEATYLSYVFYGHPRLVLEQIV